MTRALSWRLRLFLVVWGFLWTVLLPVVLAYLWRRGRKDPLYVRDLAERFGCYRQTGDWQGCIWIHAVSLGEVRSALPLIDAFLARGDRLVITHFTPAARREIQNRLGAQIAAGQVAAVWVPLELRLAYRGFFRRFQPRFGLVMEVEFWPRMIAAARRNGIALFLCNGQYPARSFARDRRGLRGEVVRGFAGVMVKDATQQARFLSLGLPEAAIRMTGELRFDLPHPEAQITAATGLRAVLSPGRTGVTFASVVEGEDHIMLDAIAQVQQRARARGQVPPLAVYVPRAPERFDAVAGLIAARGLRLRRRSEVLDAGYRGLSTPDAGLDTADILLGDSMGEMHFYLALTDRCVVGGGFARGAHNVIEPLSLRRPVLVGPNIGTIEYPALAAIEAGVLRLCDDASALAQALEPDGFSPSDAQIDAFFAAHRGGVRRTMAAIPELLAHAAAQDPRFTRR